MDTGLYNLTESHGLLNLITGVTELTFSLSGISLNFTIDWNKWYKNVVKTSGYFLIRFDGISESPSDLFVLSF